MGREQYADQVRLLVRVLPVIAQETEFALKGGTAINMFYRELPRLSVDIDLTYLPMQDRHRSLAGIQAGLSRIGERIGAMYPALQTQSIAGGGNSDTRLLLKTNQATVKVETSPVMRGTVLPTQTRRITESVESEFGFAEMQVVSFEDLFAGKIVAALDRQHPRDLYDVKELYRHEGLTDELFRVFLVYAACSNRPLHELLAPNLADLSRPYDLEFSGMTAEPVKLDALVETRAQLIDDVQSRLSGSSADFIRSVSIGVPDFKTIDLQDAEQLPAMRWKLKNLEILMRSNPEKHQLQRASLEAVLH